MAKKPLPPVKPHPKPSKRPLAQQQRLAAKKHLQVIKQLTAEQVASLASMLITNDSVEMMRMAKDKTTTNVLQRWFARVAMFGMRNGDMTVLNALLDRVVGKVKDRIEVSGPDGGPIGLSVSPMSREERMAEIERLRELRQKAGND